MNYRASLASAIVATGILLWPGMAHARVAGADHRSPPTVQALAAVVIDRDSGVVLYNREGHQRRPQASLTKMTTALVAVERSALGSTVRGTSKSLSEPSVIGIEPGDELLLKDAIYGLMLNSGNDAALAIAESVGDGSIPRFVAWMNLSVARLGLKDTHFENPNGLEQEGHYSSAYDTAMIGRELLNNAFLADVVATRQHEVPGPPLWVFTNTNPLLGRVQGITGIKTGYEVTAGRCYVVSMSKEGRQLIVSVLHDDQYAADAQRLFDWAFDSYQWSQVNLPGPNRRGSVRVDLVFPREQRDVVRAMVRLERLASGIAA